MEDTSADTPSRDDPSEIVSKLLGDVGGFPLFRTALEAFGCAYADVNARRGGDSLRSAAVVALDETAWNLMAAVVNYYCAHTLYDILTALDREEEAE